MSDEPTRAAEPSGDGPPARLKRRREFVAVARGNRVHLAGFTLQARRREADDAVQGPRVGLTVTKKEGGAVERNRMRRRFREALRHAKTLSTANDTDYVIIARRESLVLPFARLIADIQMAVRKAGAQKQRTRGAGRDARHR